MAKKLSKLMQDRLLQFGRNSRWGTCVDCPRIEGRTYPEACINTNRYDHWLDWESIKAQVDNEVRS